MGRVLLTTGGGPRARRRQRGSLGRPASARLSAICRRLFRSAGHAQLSVSSFQTLRASSQRRDRRGCATSSSCVASSSPTPPLTTIASAPRATLSLADFPSVARLLPETTSNPASRRGGALRVEPAVGGWSLLEARPVRARSGAHLTRSGANANLRGNQGGSMRVQGSRRGAQSPACSAALTLQRRGIAALRWTSVLSLS